jgi:hypothetical protein
VRLALKYPAKADNAADHAALAVRLAREEFDLELDYSAASLDRLDGQIESLREEGLSAEDAAEALFTIGCYLGEVMVRGLRGSWIASARSALAEISPWPMVVVLPGGSTWDPIGKVYQRFEVGDSEYLPTFYVAAAQVSARRR